MLFAIGELATAKQEGLPLTAVVVDDGGYGMLRYDQRHSGAESYRVGLATPDFGRLAGAFGIRATAVDGLSDDFGTALAAHLADPEPTLLVARAALTPPPTTPPRAPPAAAAPTAPLAPHRPPRLGRPARRPRLRPQPSRGEVRGGGGLGAPTTPPA